MHRSAVRGVLGFPAVAVAAVLLSPPAAFAGPPSTFVGVVLPRDARPGDVVSGSVVTNPRAFDNVPALSVVTYEIPAAKDAREEFSLRDVFVDLGDGRMQSAGGPLRVRVGQGAKAIRVTLSVPGAPPMRKEVAIAGVPAASTPSAPVSRFETSPLCVDGSVGVVRGAFGGDAGGTRITVGGHPARIVAETPRAAYWYETGATPGTARLTVEDGPSEVSFRVAVVGLEMSADKLDLKSGESTAFHVIVTGAEALPDAAWESGSFPDLADPAKLKESFPSFRPPSPGARGSIVLAIRNGSPGRISLNKEPVLLTLGKSDFPGRPYSYAGTIRGLLSGSFAVDGVIIPFLAPIVAEAGGAPVRFAWESPLVPDFLDRARQWRELARAARETAGKTSDPTNRKMWEDLGRSYEEQARRSEEIAKDLAKHAEDNPVTALPAPTPTPLTRADEKLRDDMKDSADFWRKQAEKARRWAQETTDPKTKEYWEKEAAWDDANAKRREHIAEKLGGGPPGTVSRPTDVPVAPPEVPTPPAAPPTPVAVRYPTPSPTPTPNVCPQREVGKTGGCVALVIDFANHVVGEADVEGVARLLEGIGCDVDYVAPRFLERPKTFRIKVKTPSGGNQEIEQASDPDALKKADDNNRNEWQKVHDAIEAHRKKVRNGAEIALEILDTHGSSSYFNPLLPEWPCGTMGTSFDSRDRLYRSTFHKGNYDAAHGNVCAWYVADFSCFSGLTPRAVDELENCGTATCQKASVTNCPLHAGWESDAAMSVATDDEPGSNGDVYFQRGGIENAASEENRRRALSFNSDSYYGDYSTFIQKLPETTRAFGIGAPTSRYLDHGYAKDNPPVHVHLGYGLTAAPCKGGDCK